MSANMNFSELGQSRRKVSSDDVRDNSLVRDLLREKNIVLRYKSNSTIVNEVLIDRGWHQIDESSLWNLCWSDMNDARNYLKGRLEDNQFLPNFYNCYELSKKTLLFRNMLKLKKAYLKEGKVEEAKLCDSMPVTFELPEQYLMFEDEYRKKLGQTWIVKPAIGSRGKGIFLFRDIRDLNEWRVGKDFHKLSSECDEIIPDPWLIQKYIENPYLLGGKKFDLRLYVLIPTFSPLKVWVYRGGFARLCGTKYSKSEIKDNYIHLTNSSIQLSEKCSTMDNHNQGQKIQMRDLRLLLSARHGTRRIDQLIQHIGKIILTSLFSVQKLMSLNKHSFEMFGYDILLDTNLNPWLLEVNSRPALEITDQEDHTLKYNLVSDVMNVMDFEKRMAGNEIRIGGFDLMYDGQPIFMPCPGADEMGPVDTENLNIFLGALNDREDQLKTLRSWHKYMSCKSDMTQN